MSHKNFTPRTILVGEEPIGFAVHANDAKHDAFHNVAVWRGLPNSLVTYARSQAKRLREGKSIGVPAYTANIPGSRRRANASAI